ncbi:hypothetical protein AVEN_113438-1, partial [Araneus ventricosus]
MRGSEVKSKSAYDWTRQLEVSKSHWREEEKV